MKKFLSTVLALAVAATMTTSALAATAIDTDGATSAAGKTDGDYTIGVTGTYAPATSAASTVSVDISWEDMNFTYNEGSKGDWNSATHDYDNAVASGWKSDEKSTITVKNHSNIAVKADFTFAGINGVKGNFTKDSLALVSADNDTYRATEGTTPTAPTATTDFSIDTTSPAITATGSIGTITVKIEKIEGFVYDITGADFSTIQEALTAAIQAEETKLTILGNPSYPTFLPDALKNTLNSAAAGTIELTLQDVTAIDKDQFNNALKDANWSSLKTITLPNVTTIGSNAFCDCKNLTSVNAPKLTSIGNSAFKNCYKLAAISLSEVTTVEEEAFYHCNFTSVSLPKCTTISGKVFSSCSALTSVDLPVATSIGSAAFSSCSSLESINFPKVTSVGDKAFYACTSLKNVTFGTPVTEWSKRVFGAADDYYKVNTENLTLTFAAGQKAFTGSDTDGWTITENDLTAGTNVDFCGRTFNEIKIASK